MKIKYLIPLFIFALFFSQMSWAPPTSKPQGEKDKKEMAERLRRQDSSDKESTQGAVGGVAQPSLLLYQKPFIRVTPINVTDPPNIWVPRAYINLGYETFKNPSGSRPYATLSQRVANIETLPLPPGKEGPKRVKYQHFKESFTGFVEGIKINFKIFGKNNRVIFETVFKEEIKCRQKNELVTLTVNLPSTIGLDDIAFGNAVTTFSKSGLCR